MLLSIKTKLKLSKTQEIIMNKHAGIARFTYNWGLATWNNLYKDGLKPNKYILKKFFNNHVKPEFEWIKQKGICQKITQYAFDHLGDSFSRFFSGKCLDLSMIYIAELVSLEDVWKVMISVSTIA
jgi:putative transposase